MKPSSPQTDGLRANALSLLFLYEPPTAAVNLAFLSFMLLPPLSSSLAVDDFLALGGV